jgi:hypothetical protein
VTVAELTNRRSAKHGRHEQSNGQQEAETQPMLRTVRCQLPSGRSIASDSHRLAVLQALHDRAHKGKANAAGTASCHVGIGVPSMWT